MCEGPMWGLWTPGPMGPNIEVVGSKNRNNRVLTFKAGNIPLRITAAILRKKVIRTLAGPTLTPHVLYCMSKLGTRGLEIPSPTYNQYFRM